MTSYVLYKTLVPWLCSRSQPGIKVTIRGLRGHLLHTVTFLASLIQNSCSLCQSESPRIMKSHWSMVTYRLRNERTGFGLKTHRFLRKRLISDNRRRLETFLLLFHCFSVNLNVVSCLTKSVLHHRFRLQQENLTKTEYRKIDPNLSWEVKADSHVFHICIGRAEIKHVFCWCMTIKM